MRMFVRFIGNKVCWTLDDERFYMGEKDECSPEELALCQAGGGYMPASTAVMTVAR